MRLTTRRHIEETKLQIAPLIDVVFLLIIFFMTVTTFTKIVTEDMDLPPAKKGNPQAEDKQTQVTVNVRKSGEIVVSNTAYSPTALGIYLKQLQADEKISRVLIRADEKVPFSTVRKVMQVCADRNLGDLHVAVMPPE